MVISGVFSGEVSRVSRRDPRTSGITTNYWGACEKRWRFARSGGPPICASYREATSTKLSLPGTSVKKHPIKVATMESTERGKIDTVN